MDFIAVVRSALKVSGAVSKASPLSFMQFLFAALVGISGGAATFGFSGLNEEGGYHSAPNPPPLPLAPFDAYNSHLAVYGVSVPALALAVREAIAPRRVAGGSGVPRRLVRHTLRKRLAPPSRLRQRVHIAGKLNRGWQLATCGEQRLPVPPA